MAQVVIFGADASVTMPTGGGCKFASASVNVSQGIAAARAFGDSWATKRGTGCKEASFTLSGFSTKGTTSDVPGTALMIRAGAALTITYFTSCTISGSAIFSGIGLATDFLANATSSYSGEFDGAITETWATS